MLAGAAVSATNSAASAVVSQMVIRLFAGNFNPAYKKVPRRKMRYIQMKYMLAYQSNESGDDPRAIIGGIGKQHCTLLTRFNVPSYSHSPLHRPKQQASDDHGRIQTSQSIYR